MALDVFARNLATGTTHFVSNGSGARSSSGQVISADGTVVAFVSTSNNLHPLDNDHIQDVFARNLTAEATYLISTNSTGNGSGNNASSNPVISASGSYVAFGSTATDLVLADFNSSDDVFLGQGPALPADYNDDNLVDAADYVVWRKTLNQSVAHFSGADGDGDGTIDQDDHGVWRANFGRTLEAGSQPEGAQQGASRQAAPASQEPIAPLVRIVFEPSSSPSLQGRGKARSVDVATAGTAHYECVLAELLAARPRLFDVDGHDSIEPFVRMQEQASRASRSRDAVDMAFASLDRAASLSSDALSGL
jgi:hypothetical protein